jgi:hypothetical protein
METSILLVQYRFLRSIEQPCLPECAVNKYIIPLMDDIGDQPTIIAWAFPNFEINQDLGAFPLAITQPMVELVRVPLDSRRSPGLHDVFVSMINHSHPPLVAALISSQECEMRFVLNLTERLDYYGNGLAVCERVTHYRAD